ncbi:MAG: LacI family DNA-binding transcriptional regulator [Suipraeoptans sp.]
MITRKDVAERAGVSVSVVSRTMNGRGYVAKEKKEAIFKAVRELGYRPNPISNSLKDARTYQLGFFSVNIYNSFYIELFGALSSYANKKGYTMFLFNSFNEERFRNLLLDGIIVESEGNALELQQLVGNNFFIPMVSASYGVPVVRTKRIPYVDVNTYEAMEKGLAYLMKRGHKKIAYGTPFGIKSRTSNTIHSRNVAFENVMKPIMGKRHAKYVFVTPVSEEQTDNFEREFFFEAGMAMVDTFVDRKCDATAIMCFNDEYALGVISRFKQLGYQIPTDISVMGIDGINKRKNTKPLLTTVALNIQEQAEACVDVLNDVINGKRVNAISSIKSYLEEGESVRDI